MPVLEIALGAFVIIVAALLGRAVTPAFIRMVSRYLRVASVNEAEAVSPNLEKEENENGN